VKYGKKAPAAAEDWKLFHLGRDPKEQDDVGDREPEVRADLHRRFLAQRARDRRPER
jgi:hypothetical protein